jgi:hypothetical protein
VHVATTVATANDVDTVAGRHTDLAAADLLPAEHLVDAGYVSVDHILDARAGPCAERAAGHDVDGHGQWRR